MVGKLNLDLGQDYAFDIRRARAVAEGNTSDPTEPGIYGPFEYDGEPYWFQVTDEGLWFVWFDIDSDPDPDIRILLSVFLADPAIDDDLKDAVRHEAEELGWGFVKCATLPYSPGARKRGP